MVSAQAQRAVFIHSSELEKYSYPPDCPFSSQRAAETRKILESTDLLSGDGGRVLAPSPAARQVLERFHSPRYLDALEAAPRGHLDVEGLHMGLGAADCPVFEGMYDYARLVCGGTLAGAEAILDGQAAAAFNPSGGYHHAGPEKAAGFCYINDVALACILLADKTQRVLYLDVDVHHGDGVQNAFYNRSDVMTISFHESGKTLFPGTGFEDEIGEGPGRGFCVNVPLPVGTYDDAYLRAFQAVAIPLIEAYRPEVIVLEVGMDCLSGDPLAHLSLTNNAYADVVALVSGFGKPLLITGGGGYHLANTARGWALVWRVLVGEDIDEVMSFGLGGVMLGSTDWQGGLRDRVLAGDIRQRQTVDAAVEATIEAVKANVFALHGLGGNRGASGSGS